MTWAKLDDSFPENLKVASLSDKAFRLHVTAICYCARNLTDGEIPGRQLPILGGTKALAAELNRAGLWETTSRGGWVIHDYLDYNPSRDQVDAERERKRRAGQAGGQARAIARAKASAIAPVQAPAIGRATGISGAPVPYPTPVGDAKASPPTGAHTREAVATDADPGVQRAALALERLGVRVTAFVADGVVAFLDSGSKPEWFEAAAAIAAGNGKTSWNYVKAILSGWGTDGPPNLKPVPNQPAPDARPFRFDFEAYEREQAELSQKRRLRHEARQAREAEGAPDDAS